MCNAKDNIINQLSRTVGLVSRTNSLLEDNHSSDSQQNRAVKMSKAKKNTRLINESHIQNSANGLTCYSVFFSRLCCVRQFHNSRNSYYYSSMNPKINRGYKRFESERPCIKILSYLFIFFTLSCYKELRYQLTLAAPCGQKMMMEKQSKLF